MGTSVDDARREIELLRKHRARAPRDDSIGGLVAAMQKQATSVNRKLGSLIDLWERLVPGEIAARTRLTGLRGGVLHVTVDSSSAAFELDRLLRTGLLAALRREHTATLSRVKLSVAPGRADRRRRRST